MRKLLLTLTALTIAIPPDAAHLYAQAPSHPSAAVRPKPKPKAALKPATLVPLNDHERALQLLNRFTFGPRPGEVEKLLATGPGNWFEQQLNPASIPDDALNKRLAAYPTLNLSSEQTLLTLPDRAIIQAVSEGKRPYPSDPLQTVVFEVQVYKFLKDSDSKKVAANGQPTVPPPTEAEAAEQKKADQATAARIAGDLFSLPRDQRMAALIKLPVPDRIAFTTNVAGDQKNLLLSQFTPREREVFQAMAANVNPNYLIANELAQSKVLRTILSERQLQEVMTDFWFNHFNVLIAKDSDQWYTTAYERDVIRKNSLGKFRDLLLATATSPAMMVYLDNWQSIGPGSLANGVNPARPGSKKGNRGLNENYGREVMELHTVGVNGGYTQADVTSLAAILTGWSVDRPQQAGPFLFDPKKHEPGTKTWFGYTIDDQGNILSDTHETPHPTPSFGNAPAGMRQGIAALTLLAASPKTAHFISYKLAQRFVADDPPSALIDRMAATYLATDGDIKAILRTLVQSPEFNSKLYFRNKVKTPVEFIASAFRTTATDPSNPDLLVNTINKMGMRLFYAVPPTGYYITADQWMNSAALIDRLNFAYQLTSEKLGNQKFDSAHVLALGLMSQPAGSAPQTASQTSPQQRTTRARFSEALLTSEVRTGLTDKPAPGADGQDIALHVLESAMIGSSVSPQTNELIQKQMTQLAPTSSTDSLNFLTALVMGSPDFQRR